MQVNDLPEFKECLELVMSFYSKDVTPAVFEVWSAICQPFTLEQIKKAFNAHVANPDNGQFPPKPADIIRLLDGSKTDRAMIAWGKALGAISAVGAYQDVCFDDGIIHKVIEDLGGWAKFCRTKTSELSYLQTHFCKSYQAYANRGECAFPPKLCGDRSEESMYLAKGLPVPAPVLIGNQHKCQQVMQLGNTNSSQIHRVSALIPKKLTLEDAA